MTKIVFQALEEQGFFLRTALDFTVRMSKHLQQQGFIQRSSLTALEKVILLTFRLQASSAIDWDWFAVIELFWPPRSLFVRFLLLIGL